MAIQVGGGEDDALMGQINTTPLVDVMLVLLIIFLLTVPVVSNSIRLSLPKEHNAVRESRTGTVTVSVTSDGLIYLAGTPVASSHELVERIHQIVLRSPGTSIEIQGDAAARFGPVGRVLYSLQTVGVQKVDLVLEPPH